MLQLRSVCDVADNTGAKRAAIIHVLGEAKRYGEVGDVVKAHIKEAAPDGSVKKSEVVDAVVVRTRRAIRRADGFLQVQIKQLRPEFAAFGLQLHGWHFLNFVNVHG